MGQTRPAHNCETANSKHELPVANINPAAEFETGFLEVGNLAKTELQQQRDTGLVGERNAAYDAVKLPRAHLGEESVEQGGAFSLPDRVRMKVHSSFRGVAIGRTLIPSAGIGVPQQFAVLFATNQG
ncbi:MAG: hypothetical protein WAK26_20010 [Terracidiphilus sp.]